MKRAILTSMLVVSGFLVAGAARADVSGWPFEIFPKRERVSVPELDPTAVGSALALVLGGGLVLAGRRSRKSEGRDNT